MFERSLVDNSTQLRVSAVPADITLNDGQVLRGKFLIRADRAIADVLNASGQFLDFEPYSGERRLISKSAIMAVKIVNVPAPRNLPSFANSREPFDPYKVLGLKRGATLEDVKKAYHDLSKTYHPDRYANAGLPKEVSDYINVASRRLNAAFAALKDQPARSRPRPAAETQQTAPIYTTPARA